MSLPPYNARGCPLPAFPHSFLINQCLSTTPLTVRPFISSWASLSPPTCLECAPLRLPPRSLQGVGLLQILAGSHQINPNCDLLLVICPLKHQALREAFPVISTIHFYFLLSTYPHCDYFPFVLVYLFVVCLLHRNFNFLGETISVFFSIIFSKLSMAQCPGHSWFKTKICGRK
ncbi:hypothetical protein HJG60_008549 [Phyllostomus discolor]|uniref:Uncharacterized protein n=1 Tax=Phyllostomus discolor TaxID=89673 RepID=A0A833YXV1_9CHIR|nr:hypothetical protein HJG60_008549 [Phyllostomus discolor]